MITVKDLSISFRKRKVLDGITLGIKKGEFVAIVGPSGCGKSTLLKLVAGLIKPKRGKILVDRNSLSIIFQTPHLFPWRSVKENILLPVELNKGKKERYKDILKLINLEKFENYYPFELSGGMQQKVAIARALISRPKVLLMDEPFSALDEITRSEFNEELLRITKKLDLTVVFVTHSITEALYLADRVIILSNAPARIKCEYKVKTKDKDSKDFRRAVKWIKEKL